MFNLPNKITLARIALIPIFMIIMLAPFDWGRLEVGDESIPVAHLAGPFYLLLHLQQTGWTGIMPEN